MSSKFIQFFTPPLYIEESDKRVRLKGYIRLRGFQHELLKIFMDTESKDVVLLSAPTGAGKTLTLLLPLFANLELGEAHYYGAVGIYPSRELAKDQMASVANMLDALIGEEQKLSGAVEALRALGGSEVRKLLEKYENERGEECEKAARKLDECLMAWVYTTEDGRELPVILFLSTSDSVEALAALLHGAGIIEELSNMRALEFLATRLASCYRVIFAVPEYPYLLAGRAYGEFHAIGAWLRVALRELASLLAHYERGDLEGWFEALLRKMSRQAIRDVLQTTREEVGRLKWLFGLYGLPVFFDEFHLYSGFSLASFVSLLYAYLREGAVRKIVISSATPRKIVRIRRGGTDREKDFLELVEALSGELGYSFRRIEARVATEPKEGYAQVRKRTLVKVYQVLTEISGAPAYGLTQRHVGEVLKIEEWQEDYRRKGRVMVIVDRVASVFEAGKVFHEVTGEKAVAVTSIKVALPEYVLSPLRANLRAAKAVVGNMSIAFGLDIRGMDLGVIAAKDHLSAIQKIGRIGRGEGDDTAIVYLLLPDFAASRASELCGRTLPYTDFLERLKELYPKAAAETVLGWRVGVLKVLLPAWAYTLANMVAERDTLRERARSEGAIPHVREFLKLVELVGSFLEKDNLPRALRLYVKRHIHLTPLALYHLFSFRSAATVKVKADVGGEVVEESVDLVVAGRNLKLNVRDGELWVEGGYAYTGLWLGVRSGERTKTILEKLKWSLVAPPLLAEVLKGEDINAFQGREYIADFESLTRALRDTPVLVIKAGKELGEDFIEYLAATQSAIPIYAMRERMSVRRGGLLGALYLL